MIKYKTGRGSKCFLQVRGSSKEIGCDAAYMITLIYKNLFNTNPAAAATFREATMYAINEAMDAIERGEFRNDDHTT